MILPSTYPAVVVLLVLALLCLGSWANTQKRSGKWRFELFYYDFAVGAVLCAVLAAFTLGTLNSQELTFQDNFLIASRRAMAYGFVAGMVFNLSNMLLLGAIQVSGMAVAFPISFGLALAIGAISSYLSNPALNGPLLFSGAVLALVAVVTVAFANVLFRDAQAQAKGPLRPDPRASRAVRPASPGVGIALSVVSGLVMSLYPSLSESARAGETALSPYGAALLFAAGVLFSTFFYSPFFLNFPVQGKTLQFWDYLKGTKNQHLWGILGGILWMTGLLAIYTAAAGSAGTQAAPAMSYGLWYGVPVVAILWGLLAWREFQDASLRVKMLLTATLVLYAAGAAVVAVAPLYPR